MTNERIRPARAEDAARIAEIEIVNNRLFFYPIFRTDRYFFSELTVPAVIEYYRREPARIAHTFVYDDGVVKGFVRVNGEEIEKLFVEPTFQNAGIGSTLLTHAIAAGGRRLLALEKNGNAIRLYERFGFHPTAHRQRVNDTPEFLVRLER